MLLGGAGLLAFAKTTEDAVLLQQCAAGGTLDLDHLGVINVAPGRNDVEVEILAQDYYAGSILEHVSGVALHGLNWYRGLVAREWRGAVFGGGGGNCLCNGPEEI